ncbi:MAG: hypothetical protein K2Y27_24610 [Xanthobacteraceae bacterium]|nr:hypothetical protein [Xanthobacteraceae bacterium]
MSVNMDIGVSVPPGQFGPAEPEAEAEAISFDWVQDLMLAAGTTLGVLASCSLSVLIFLS